MLVRCDVRVGASPALRRGWSRAERLHYSARTSRRSQPASAPGRGESRVLRATEADTVPISARTALHIGEAASPRCFLDIASARAAAPQGLGPRLRRGSLPERVAPASLGICCNRHPSLRVSLRGHPDCAKTTDKEPADNNNCGPDTIRHAFSVQVVRTRSTTLAHDRSRMRMLREDGHGTIGPSADVIDPSRLQPIFLTVARDRAADRGCTGSCDGAEDVGPPGEIRGGFSFWVSQGWNFVSAVADRRRACQSLPSFPSIARDRRTMSRRAVSRPAEPSP